VLRCKKKIIACENRKRTYKCRKSKEDNESEEWSDGLELLE